MDNHKANKKEVRSVLSEIKEKGFNDERKSKLIRSLNKAGLSRTFEVAESQIDRDNRTLTGLAVSSEDPYERWFGIEILDHKDGAIAVERLNNEAPFLYQHDPNRDIGTVIKSSAKIQDGKLRVDVRFQDPEYNEDAKRVWNAMLDGHRKKISIGYVIHELQLEKENKDGLDEFRVTKWEPLEVSSVSVPADDSVGIGRDADLHQEDADVDELVNQSKKDLENENKTDSEKQNGGNITMAEETKAPTREEILQQERERLSEVESLEKKHNIDLTEFKFGKKSNADIAEVRGYVLENIPEDKPLDTPASELDMSEKEVEKYNILNAIRYLVDPVKYTKTAGREIEASNEVAKKLGTQPRGLFIPYDIQKRIRTVSKRDLTTGGSTTGAELVGTDHIPSLIELLRNKMLLTQMGARYMSGLVGNVAIPRWDGAATAGWVSTEGAGTSESTPTTGSLTLSPKEVSANVQYTRQLVLQSSPDVAALVEDDLMKVLALAIDKAGFHGAGASGEPQGIVGTSGVGAVSLASADWDAMVEFESDVDTANALDGTLYYITTPAVRGTLKSRAKESGYPVYIVSENNMSNGYPVWTSGQIAANYMIFGNFAQVIIGEWGGLDIVVEQSASTGKFTVGAFKTVDIGIRQASAFSVGSSFS